MAPILRVRPSRSEARNANAEPCVDARCSDGSPRPATTSRSCRRTRDAAPATLEALGVTERSVLGALAANTGGLTIDRGWLSRARRPGPAGMARQAGRRARRRPRRRRRLLQRRQAARARCATSGRTRSNGSGRRWATANGCTGRSPATSSRSTPPALARLGGRARSPPTRAQDRPAAVHARGPLIAAAARRRALDRQQAFIKSSTRAAASRCARRARTSSSPAPTSRRARRAAGHRDIVYSRRGDRGALAVLPDRSARWAGWWLIALLIAVFRRGR